MPCTTLLAGKLATHDGSTLIARNDDGSFEAKRLVVVPPEKQPKKYKCKISHREVKLPENPMRYTACPNVKTDNGTWAACGINEANVGMTATETVTSNPRALSGDPYVRLQPKKGRTGKEVPGGIGEEDLVVLVLPYIRSAREGVLRLGALLEEYGTYEPNGIAFNDADEVWWLETIGGHHWIARRVPDDRVVIMPNQFGLDHFDFDDACGAQKDHLCSADLKAYAEACHLQLDSAFNPRLAFGSRSDSDHIYNTPRAWYMARYFLPRSFRWDGPDADYTPESDDIPWSMVPEHLVTVEDFRYLLSSHYQGTPYDPYDKISALHGKYRSIAVPNSDVSIILQIRGNQPEAIRGVEWVTMGGSGFTCCFPVYANVPEMPKYLSGTPEKVTSGYMYWDSRLIAALTDAHYPASLIHDERYQNKVLTEGRRLLYEYDGKAGENASQDLLKEANEKIVTAVREATEEAMEKLLGHASEHMKIRYHRGDN